MTTGNFWLNIINLEEMSNKLRQLYAPWCGRKWGTKLALSLDMQTLYDEFFLKNREYLKFKHFVTIYFEIIDVMIGNNELAWQLDSVVLTQNTY